jgi:hypothetical protein
MDGSGAVRAKGEAKRDRQTGETRRDETMVAGRQAGQASMAVLPSRCTRPQHLPQAFEKRFRITLPAVPAALIERYGHACSSLQSRPACSTHSRHCPIFAPSLPSRRPRAPQAISRALSPACSIDGAKWSNLVTIARSEGCHSCRPNHLHSQKKLRIFRHPCQWYGGTC